MESIRQGKTVWIRRTRFVEWKRSEFNSINAAKKANGLNARLLVGPLPVNENKRGNTGDRRVDDVATEENQRKGKKDRRKA